MGWFWSWPQRTGGVLDSPTQVETISRELPREEVPHQPPPPPLDMPDIPDKPRTLTRDEQADAELQKFLKELDVEEKREEPKTPFIEPPERHTVNKSTISPDVLYPITMSCRQAFDHAFYCQSLGGQWTNVYRYGGVRNCSEQWGNFWFCMRTNRGMMTEEERKIRIQAHYREKDKKYRVGPSSEDIWRLREERVDGAFEGNLEAAEEAERREAE
ncbi:MAG: hypothetical protein MMC33_007305 [Icmadophila ericetorum]|nr:hypothetical protein [Icmadophila ericetorum]